MCCAMQCEGDNSEGKGIEPLCREDLIVSVLAQFHFF